MCDFSKDFLLPRREYGVLFPYLMSEDVEQVFWNGRGLWIDDKKRGRYPAKEVPDKDFADRFTMLMSNQTDLPFNPLHPVLCIERENLFVQMVHKSVADNGTTVLLRKKEPGRRPDAKGLVESGFITEESLSILKTAAGKESILIVGTARSGRSELVRLLSRFLKPQERTVVLERGKRWQLAVLNPEKDVVELVTPSMAEAVKACVDLGAGYLLVREPDADTLREMMRIRQIHGIHSVAVLSGRSVREAVEGVFYESSEGEIRQWKAEVFRSFDLGVELKMVDNDREDRGIRRLVKLKPGQMITLTKRGDET